MYTPEFISTITKTIQDIANENNALKKENHELKAKVFELEALPFQELFKKMPEFPKDGTAEVIQNWWDLWNETHKALLSVFNKRYNLEKQGL